ncbi:phosphoribosylglycinamide formyltransferase [Pectinatus cerevisiiphilus]|uniref:Phosphoribosylglycinamide formyltransferase n=1 Tax=Pectinatus cerevisiiphilus TaxID=86956 RepID=A0A4R3K9Y7_9FIRM|nr:phosphoribosylglycinamide formyltransferase [Pectinatus cerevisiiphilus]TCS79735.1 phosphoribosylglycinamide formyltransferase-1 [Pectinatus cerevisiiphilus]
MNKPVLGVLASGRGTNLQSIMNALNNGQFSAEIGIVITDKPQAGALERAAKAGIPNICIDRKKYGTREDFEKKLLSVLRKHNVEHIILAGFMRILSPLFIKEYKNHILNIHPALLPSFTGAHAHRDVLAYGVKISGCTVHFVDEGTDSGPIIIQAAVPVLDDDTEESLAARVLQQEHIIYPKAVELYLKGKLKITGRRVLVKE